MAFKGTTGGPLFEPYPVYQFPIGGCEIFQFIYYDFLSESVSQIEPHRFFRSLRQFDPILSFQKNLQLIGPDISFAGLRRGPLNLVRRFLFRAIPVSEVTARDQKDRQHNQQAERVVLPRPSGVRPEEDIFNSDQKRLHRTTVLPGVGSGQRVAGSRVCSTAHYPLPTAHYPLLTASTLLDDCPVAHLDGS